MNAFPPRVIVCLVVAAACLIIAAFIIWDSWRIGRR